MTGRVVALVVASAVRGDNQEVVHPFVSVRGVPLLVHSVGRLVAAERVAHVVVAVPPSDVSAVTAALAPVGAAVTVVPSHAAGHAAALRSAWTAATQALPDVAAVLVHELACAFTPSEVIDAVADAVLAGAAAVVPVLPATDTVKRVGPAGRVTTTLDRTALRTVQAPQGFTVDVFRQVFGRDGSPSAQTPGDVPSVLAGIGAAVTTVPGHAYGMRIATLFDLTVAEAVLAESALLGRADAGGRDTR